MLSLVENRKVVLEKMVFKFRNYLQLEEDPFLYLHKLESPSFKDSLY